MIFKQSGINIKIKPRPPKCVNKNSSIIKSEKQRLIKNDIMR